MTTLPSRSTLLALVASLVSLAPLMTRATILYTDPDDITVTMGQPLLHFDLDRSGTGSVFAATAPLPGVDFALGETDWQFAEQPEQPLIYNFGTGQAASLHVLSPTWTPKVPVGSTIDSSLLWGGTILEWMDNGDWQEGGEGYLALRLILGGGNFNYGWARINYNDAAGQITLLDFAVQTDANTAIQAGVVPEPGAFVLLAIGAGLVALRQGRPRS